MPEKATVTKIAEEVGLTPQGQVLRQIRVEFMVGTHGPFVRRYESKTFSVDQARADMDAFARDLARLTG